MNIVGIYDFPSGSFRSHDKAASIITNNNLFAYEEAKLSQVKEDGYAAIPERSIMMGFKELSLTPDKIDLWTFPSPPEWINIVPTLKNFFEEIFAFKFHDLPDFENFLDNKVRLFKHHDAHIALGAYTSLLENALVVSMDGGGDYGDSRHLVCKNFTNHKILDIPVVEAFGSFGIANFHGWLTESIGFTEDGKFSGLAAYGNVNSVLYDKLSNLLTLNPDGFYTFKKERTHAPSYDANRIKSDSFERKKYLYHQPGKTNVYDITKNYQPQDVAATGTRLIIDCVIRTLTELKKKTPHENLVLVGGLFNNVSINRAVAESGIFKKYHFTMSPGDAGIALGLALLGKHCDLEPKPPHSLIPFSPFVGPSFSPKEIEDILSEYKVKFESFDEEALCFKIANLIANCKTVGTFYGRAEYGPRSLGHRSILGDPRNVETKQRINLHLKKRDWFMPYAPAILHHEYSEWTNLEPSPYMQVASYVNKDKISLIPSAVHIDGTARFQSVYKEISPFLYKIIENFRVITGIPIVLNTSFNRHGIATIGTPRAALDHLFAGTVDYLILGTNIISLNENRYMHSNTSLHEHLSESELLFELIAHYQEKINRLENILNSNGSKT